MTKFLVGLLAAFMCTVTARADQKMAQVYKTNASVYEAVEKDVRNAAKQLEKRSVEMRRLAVSLRAKGDGLESRVVDDFAQTAEGNARSLHLQANELAETTRRFRQLQSIEDDLN